MARRIAVEIVGDASSLERAFKKSSKSAQQFNGDIAKTGKGRKAFSGAAKGAGLLTGALGVGGLASAAKAAFGEMGDAQKVSAQTAAALKSTKGAAGVTAKEMDKLSTSLMNKSGVDDEAIKSGQNLLLTFTDIKNGVGKADKIFDQATGTMLDMSTALGQDTKTSAIQLGKALNNPVKGITALQRVGVSFTDGQKKQIEAMVDAGDTMGAQKIILQELNKEFGGSAEAAGKTLPGKFAILQESLLNMGGAIAEQLTPQITDTITKMTDWITNTENQKTVMETAKGITEALSTAVGLLRDAFQVLSDIVGGNKKAIELLIGIYAGWKIAKFGATVLELAGNFGTLASKQKSAAKQSTNLSNSLAGKAGVAAGVAAASIAISEMIRQIPGWDKAWKGFGSTVYDVAEKLNGMGFKGKALGFAAGGLLGGLAVSKAKAPAAPTLRNPAVNAITGRQGGMAVGTVNVFGIQDPRKWEDHMTKRAKKRPHRRRGS